MASHLDYRNRDAADSIDPLVELRKRALQTALERKADRLEPGTPENSRLLLEELHIHQIELELQNEELRRVQAELELSRSRYFDLYDLAPVGYLSVGPDGSIAEANLQASALFGASRSALVGRRFTRYIAVESQDEYHLTRLRAQETGAPQKCELKMVHHSEPLFWARLELTLARENDQPMLRIVIVDIDDRKRFEDALRKASEQLSREKKIAEEATSAKSLFLSSMSHEIRTPLNGVVGMASLLLQTELNDEQRGYARIVSDSAEALLGLVNDILDFSKIEAGQFELDETAFDLECVTEDVLDILSCKANEKSLELACWYPNALPRCFIGDAGRLRQVLTNLVSNAIKFTAAGYVLVEVEAIELASAEWNVKLSVHDTGIGISKEQLGHLFQRFRQADASISRLYGGTGLGLSIVKQIVEMMEGEVTVASMEGEGSTFSCKLPLRLDRTEPSALRDTGALKGIKALVSGSQRISSLVVAEWCERWGMSVEQCDLSDLGSRLREAADRAMAFQVVILDGNLKALSQAAADFHSQTAASPPKLVFLTVDSLERAAQLRPDAVLPTPARAKLLADRLCHLLSVSPPTPVALPATALGKPSKSVSQPDCKVLVIDDNLVNQKLACALLAKLGCEVDTADDGREALSKVSQREYNLVFMDCVMPEMDGFAATIAIRNLAGGCANVPIVALTASATPEDRTRCLDAGMNDFLTKPIRSEQLASCLTKWLKAPHLPPR